MVTKIYKIKKSRSGKTDIFFEGTISELTRCFSYTLECGQSYEREKGNKKINIHPTTMKALIRNLDNAVNNSAANGHTDIYFKDITNN